MSQIILARVAQKIATSAAWAIDNPVLYDGEWAVARDSGVYKFKIGNGTDNWITLPFVTITPDNAFLGSATHTTNPGSPSSPVWYFANDAGTYTHFLDVSSTAIVVSGGDGVVILSYNGTHWFKVVAI